MMVVFLPQTNLYNMKKTFVSIAIVVIALLGIKYAFPSDGFNNPPKSNAIISGQVHDFSTGESLAGVVVKILGTSYKAYTDLDGNFEFDEMLPGNYDLVFSFISYNNSLVENLEITESEKENIEVKLQEAN